MEKVIFLDIDGVLTSNERAENVLKQEGYRVMSSMSFALERLHS